MVIGIAVSSFLVEPAAGAASSAARDGCGLAVLRDWTDGRIDETYPVSCYRDAIRDMPEDLRLYSSAVEDVRAAAARTVRRPASAGAGSTAAAAGSRALAGESTTDTIAFVAVVVGGLLGAGVALVGASALRQRRSQRG